MEVTFEENGDQLWVTRREKVVQVASSQERHGGKLPVPIQAGLQGLSPAQVANLRVLLDKH